MLKNVTILYSSLNEIATFSYFKKKSKEDFSKIKKPSFCSYLYKVIVPFAFHCKFATSFGKRFKELWIWQVHVKNARGGWNIFPFIEIWVEKNNIDFVRLIVTNTLNDFDQG